MDVFKFFVVLFSEAVPKSICSVTEETYKLNLSALNVLDDALIS